MLLFICFVTLGIDCYSLRVSLQHINYKILAKRHMVIIFLILKYSPHCPKKCIFFQYTPSASGKINPITVVKALLKFSWVHNQSNSCVFPDFVL